MRVSRTRWAMPGFEESHRIAKRESFGASVCRMSRRLALRSGAISELPVALPPGRARLATRPVPTGSLLAPSTIGIVPVAFLAAKPAGVPAVTMMSTRARQFFGKIRQQFLIACRRLPLDGDVFAIDIAELLELAQKRH